jgi:hypothetical protein
MGLFSWLVMVNLVKSYQGAKKTRSAVFGHFDSQKQRMICRCAPLQLTNSLALFNAFSQLAA